MKTIVIATGGFDPLHMGHLKYLHAAKQLGDILVVGVNSDAWLARKKGKPFQDEYERFAIIDSLKPVDRTIFFDDRDGTAIDAIKAVRRRYPDDLIIFANGGDRTEGNIPEMNCDVENVAFVFGVGGDRKDNSSSELLRNWSSNGASSPGSTG
jgi:cytidyltransferase-like protein